jgi:hypothetical protein
MEKTFWAYKIRKFSFISKKIGDKDGPFVNAGLLFPAFRLWIFFIGVRE